MDYQEIRIIIQFWAGQLSKPEISHGEMQRHIERIISYKDKLDKAWAKAHQ